MSIFKKTFARLFPKEPETISEGVETAPLDPTKVGPTISGALYNRILIGSAQSVGVERTHNEDALLSMLGNSSGEDAPPEFGIFLVADGMGGHRSGEVASAISIRSVAHRLTQDSLLNLFDINQNEDTLPLQELLRESLEEANQHVVTRVPGGGTTMTAVLMVGRQLTIGHVGDTRAYIISNGNGEVITRDHSLVKRLEELGQLTEEEAAVHPQRNVLYKAIGQGANLEVDVTSHPVPNNAYLLICSDGLWGVISDEEILSIIGTHPYPQEACDELIRAANNAGGPDNITAILVYFPPK